MSDTHKVKMTIKASTIEVVMLVDDCLMINGAEQECDTAEAVYLQIQAQLEFGYDIIKFEYEVTK